MGEPTIEQQATLWLQARQVLASQYKADLDSGLSFNEDWEDPEDLPEPLRSEVLRQLSMRVPSDRT